MRPRFTTRVSASSSLEAIQVFSPKSQNQGASWEGWVKVTQQMVPAQRPLLLAAQSLKPLTAGGYLPHPIDSCRTGSQHHELVSKLTASGLDYSPDDRTPGMAKLIRKFAQA
jgi:hypothetical protein